MEYGQLPLPAEELGRFTLAPGALGKLLKITLPRQGIWQVRLSAQSTGWTFKTLSPCRVIRQPRLGTQWPVLNLILSYFRVFYPVCLSGQILSLSIS